ncbi:hypothetical protein H5410_041399 [Solanum commersonii]|uniref:Uncharacterized protein n=1 Tax=Solanum commersonii TaxID=4109 RepID=A0A9J5XSU4_SOLCO|nr:hypothetical protein H5410_041399 [Solanum commersonii]
MVEIDNYQDNSTQSSDDVESSNEKSDSEDEENSRDTQTGDEGEFALITGLNCSAYPRDAKMKKFLKMHFPHLEKYAKKSLDSPLPVPHLLRWHMEKNNNIIEGDPFKYKGKHMKNYMETLKPYMGELKDTVLDVLKENLKGVTVLTSTVENVEDEYLSDYNPSCENTVSSGHKNIPSTSKDDNLCERVASLEQSMEKLRRMEKNKKKKATDLAVDDEDFATPTVDEILPLAITDDDFVAVDEYFADEVDEVEEEKEQEEVKIAEKEEEKLEKSEEEKLEEKKKEQNKEEHIASGEKEKEQQEEKMIANEKEEKLEEEGLAIDVTEEEKKVDVMSMVMELNGEVNSDE